MARTPSGIGYDAVTSHGTVPVVLLHAGIADRRMWEPQWAALTTQRDAVRLDLRGFGGSDRPPDVARSDVADVLEVLDRLDLDRAHLVGASRGSGVAVEVALTRPAAVASLLLGPPGGCLLAERTADLQTFLDTERSALAEGDLDAAVQANIDAWVVGPRRTPARVEPGVCDLVRLMQRRAFEIDASWPDDIEDDELDPPALARLGEIDVPTLVLTGGFDLDTTHDAARRVVAEIPGARAVTWEDTAHLPSLERPEDFGVLLRAWLLEVG